MKESSAYSIKPADYATKFLYSAIETDNRLPNQFFLYVLEDLHTGQSLGALKFTSDDPKFVREAVDKVHPAIP